MILELVLFAVLVFLLFKMNRPPPGLPPGEWGLPILGALPPRNVPLSDYLVKLSEKHGDIYTFKAGSRTMVVLMDFAQIKQAFSRPECQGRPDLFTFKVFSYFLNGGLITSEGAVWQENRRFALHHLKNFGMGKSSIESIIQSEVSHFLSDLDKSMEKPMEIAFNLNVSILNIIWQLAAARRYEVTDSEILNFAQLLTTNFDIIQGPATLLDFFPWMKVILPRFIQTKWMRIDELEDSRELLSVFLRKVIHQHWMTLDPANPRDYIDVYILEYCKNIHPSVQDGGQVDDEEAMEKKKEESFLKVEWRDLCMILADLFVAGSETTSSTLRWVALYMARNPEIQKKIQKEIDDVVPRDTMPSLEHRDRLVYLEASLREVQRKASLVPVGIMHTVTEDTVLFGYKFPKGTGLLSHAQACHNNPKYWEKPEEFYPEHFIDKEGKLISKKDGYLPFSLGRRQCLGESVARMELFMFTAAILQKFTIERPPGEPLLTENDPTTHFFHFAKPFKVIFRKRDCVTSEKE